MRGRALLLKLEKKGITEEEFLELKLITAKVQKTLLPVLEQIEREGGLIKINITVKLIVAEAAKPSPVCNLIPPMESIHNILKKIIKDEIISEDELSEITREAPFILKLLKKSDGSLPPSVSPFIEKLLELSLAPFTFKSNTLLPSTQHVFGAYFPNFPKRCVRGKYANDLSVRAEPSEEICSKPARSTLTPGLFHLSCEHGMLASLIITSNYVYM